MLDGLWGSRQFILGEQVGLSLKNITIQHVSNTDTPRDGDPTVYSFIRSDGAPVHIEDCQFIDIATGGTGAIDPGGVLTYTAPEGLSGQVTIENCLFVDCVGTEAGVADVTRGQLSIKGCTVHQSRSTSGGSTAIHASQGSLGLSSSLFTGSSSAAYASYLLAEGSTAHVAYSLFDAGAWAAGQPEIAGVTSNLISTPANALEQVKYVNSEDGDFRLRWDSECLDRGDPDPGKLDFDLTRSDMGWKPDYPIIEIEGLTEIDQAGNYLITSASATIQGSENTVIPDGTTIKQAGDFYLYIRDANSSGGFAISVGSSDGARTSFVGSPTDGSIVIGTEGTAIDAADCSFSGVLFNRFLEGNFLRFQNCNLDLNGAGGNVLFNNITRGEIHFDEVCRGSFRNFTFIPEQIDGGTPGIGCLNIMHSDIDLLNVDFDEVPDGFWWKVWQSGTAPGSPRQVFAGCTFLSNNGAGVYPLFTHDAALTLHHNQFTDIQQGAIYMYTTTLNMSNGAMNTFDKPNNLAYNEFPIIVGWAAPLDLQCGFNSITYANINTVDKFIETACYSGDWSSNFWGRTCDLPIDPFGYLPSCVSLVSPALSSCPATFVPCDDQIIEETPLYTLGCEADAAFNYQAACGYYKALLVEFPESKYCTKVTGSMKAIGLVTQYGLDSYGQIRLNLEEAAAASDSVNYVLSVSQLCAAWCVEARHGDRPAALALLEALQLEVKGNKEAEILVAAAIAEIGSYPEQGGMSAAGPGMDTARMERQLQQLRAFQLALLPEGSRPALEDLDEVTEELQPLDFQLIGCYPNPFNPVTTIELQSMGDLPLVLEIYNLAGQRVARLLDEPIAAGHHRVHWDASSMASGIYFLRAEQGGEQQIRKLMLIR